MKTFAIKTQHRSQMIAVNDQVQRVIRESNLTHEMAVVYVPHTTAGITINENADPDVVHDLLGQFDEIVPWHQDFYRHADANSAAHVKATLTGSSLTVPIQRGHLLLGRWQGIFFL